MGINNLFNKVTAFIDNKNKEKKLYNQKLAESKTFELDNSLNLPIMDFNEGRCQEYKDLCVYINLEDAKKIDSLIAMNEVVLNITNTTEKVDNQNFLIVLTNFRIIIIGKDKYHIYNYQDIVVLEIISKSLMSQVINFNDIVLVVDVNQDDLTIFYNLIVNIQYRNSIIADKIKYLCGINPVYQKLNNINSGISIDANENIVFHDKKENNYLYRYELIQNYELLEDNTPVLKKKNFEQRRGMGFAKQECTKMSLRVTLTNNQAFEIRILEPTAFSSSYNHKDSVYIKHYNFAKEIIDKLDSMNPRKY